MRIAQSVSMTVNLAPEWDPPANFCLSFFDGKHFLSKKESRFMNWPWVWYFYRVLTSSVKRKTLNFLLIKRDHAKLFGKCKGSTACNLELYQKAGKNFYLEWILISSIGYNFVWIEKDWMKV